MSEGKPFNEETAAAAGLSIDRLLSGAVHVVQPIGGFRAGLDAVLLAASVSGADSVAFAEAGSGSGAASLCLAHRFGSATVTGYDISDDLVAIAALGAALNRFEDRVRFVCHDVARRPLELENRFDQVIANPPWFETSNISMPSVGKRRALLDYGADLRAWLLFVMHLAVPGGRVTLIHRAASLANVLALINPLGGEIEVLPIRPHPGAPAKRILVRARKGLRRGDVRLYDGLDLYDAQGGAPTARHRAVMEGAGMEWV